MMEVVTYANKSAGMFDRLINNEHGVQIKVLGWGTKWNGFKDKINGIYRYLENKHDDDIVIYVDGFDSEIKKDISGVKQAFDSYDCKVLFSKNSNFIDQKMIFGTCTNNLIANAGMFMGYVKYLKLLLKDVLNEECQDDQININKLCKKYDFIQVDKFNLIFKNRNFYTNSDESSDEVFLQRPGKLTMYKVLNFMQFFYPYILIVHLILFARYKNTIILTCIVLISVYYYFRCDRSCV